LVSQPLFNHIEATASNVRKILYVIKFGPAPQEKQRTKAALSAAFHYFVPGVVLISAKLNQTTAIDFLCVFASLREIFCSLGFSLPAANSI